jgi:hypothetical protein
MKKLSCLLLLAVMSSPAWADCTYPKKPGKMPDGKTATRDEMVATQKVVKQYQADMTSYLECLKAEHQAALAKDESLSDKQKKTMTDRYTQKNDAAVDEAHDVANRFNEQLRVFREKSGSN